jgi:predicted 2-oxoglutarate/Fe(II)-dependent dioxygenase YbiX
MSKGYKMTIQVNGLFPGELYPDATVGGCIDIFENAWPNPLETIQMIENETLNPDSGVSWTRATTIGGGINQEARTNYHLGITSAAQESGNPVAQNIHNQMYLLLLASTIPYAKKQGVEEMYHEPYNMLRYRGGQEYKAHADGTTDIGRSISAIVYLNDDYEGGEVEFVNFGIKIKPEPGMLLLFPSNYAYRHIAHPVTNGTKYAIVTWIKDRQL